jgi:hypothetical protein
MSFSSADTNSLSSIGANAGIPALNVADIPADVRNGNKQAQQAYTEGLAFEEVLVNQLTTQLANTMGSNALDPSSSSSSDSSSQGGSGLLSGSSSSAYASLIPSALTSSIMDGGGLGLAQEFAQTIDPTIADPAAGASASTGSASTGVAATGSAATGSAASLSGAAGATPASSTSVLSTSTHAGGTEVDS